MKRFLNTITNIKTVYVLIFTLVITLLANFIYYDHIKTDEIIRKYKQEQQAQEEAEAYQEHDELMADFKDDLAEIELEAEKETESNTTYFDDAFFNITYDSIPPLGICLGLALFVFISFQFFPNLKDIAYGNLLKSTLIAYLIFPLSTLFTCIWFGLFQTKYEVTDLYQMEGILNPSIQSFLAKPTEDQWYHYLFADMTLQNLLFALLIPFFLKTIIGFKYSDLFKKMTIALVGFFIVFHFVSPYQLYVIFLFD